MSSLLIGQVFAQSTPANPSQKKDAVVQERRADQYTFPLSDKVSRQKVTFKNRYGISLTGDLYVPKNNASSSLPGIVVSGPFGAVKEQSSGLYAMKMAENGFVSLAFDPSFTGESGGEPRNVASPEINTEDFSAAVDYMGLQKRVDRNRIGIIGICGFGGMALNATAVDKRIKAVATTSMYNMSRVMSKGYYDKMPLEQRAQMLEQMSLQRWTDAEKGAPVPGPRGLPVKLEGNEPQFVKEYFDYYRTNRGFHPRSINSNGAWLATNALSFMNFPLMTYIQEISPRPILIIAGEKAHSRYFSEDAYKAAAEPKELMIIPNAVHVDLYDKVDVIPFDKLATFFKENLMTIKRDYIFGKGIPAGNQIFSGTVWVNMLHTDEAKLFDTQVYNVHFNPSARTFWHSHHGGQILLVTEGFGYYQEKGKPARELRVGDVVAIEPNVIHWHGASSESAFTHVGLTTRVHEGPAEWLGPVAEEEYRQAVSK